jgi:hypothetical protein
VDCRFSSLSHLLKAAAVSEKYESVEKVENMFALAKERKKSEMN